MIRATRSGYVLDASVAAKWFTRHDEPDRRKATAIRALYLSGQCTLMLPEFALLEILNAIRFSAPVEEEDTARALELLEKLRLDVVPLDWELLREATEISWTTRAALYDAAYVALAERRGVPFLTADEAMIRKLKDRTAVVRLGDLEFD
jgi:predicted nucleic acid-binding protein